jgi:predicted nucleotidyltransferase
MDPQRLGDVARRHGIRLLLRFGSMVTGRPHPQSDLDLAVLLDAAPATFDAHAALVDDLQALHPGQDVDVAIVNRADPLLLKQIAEHCELVYGAVSDLHELKIYAFKRYQDHRRYLDQERMYVERVINATAP